jgi:hypothetical protein
VVDSACKAIDAQSVPEAEGQAVSFRKITMVGQCRLTLSNSCKTRLELIA